MFLVPAHQHDTGLQTFPITQLVRDVYNDRRDDSPMSTLRDDDGTIDHFPRAYPAYSEQSHGSNFNLNQPSKVYHPEQPTPASSSLLQDHTIWHMVSHPPAGRSFNSPRWTLPNSKAAGVAQRQLLPLPTRVPRVAGARAGARFRVTPAPDSK
jgi:hypothetical protein